MVDNPLYIGKHGLDIPGDNYPINISAAQSKDSATQTDNVAVAANTTPDDRTTELMQLQMQIEGM